MVHGVSPLLVSKSATDENPFYVFLSNRTQIPPLLPPHPPSMEVPLYLPPSTIRHGSQGGGGVRERGSNDPPPPAQANFPPPLAHLWATSDFAPRSEAEGIPEAAGVT